MNEKQAEGERAHAKARKVKIFLTILIPIYLLHQFLSPIHVRLIKTRIHGVDTTGQGRSVYGYNSTFSDFLDDHFKRPPRKLTAAEIGSGLVQEEDTSPHIWLTQSDQRWINTGTSTLALFIQRLNFERLDRYNSPRPTALVVLCLDQICIERCKNSQIPMYCYGGYKYTRPPQMPVATWPKIAGLIDTLEFRDAFYVDSDVAFKRDPYPIIESYMEKYDLISSESEAHEHFNTGKLFYQFCFLRFLWVGR